MAATGTTPTNEKPDPLIYVDFLITLRQEDSYRWRAGISISRLLILSGQGEMLHDVLEVS